MTFTSYSPIPEETDEEFSTIIQPRIETYVRKRTETSLTMLYKNHCALVFPYFRIRHIHFINEAPRMLSEDKYGQPLA